MNIENMKTDRQKLRGAFAELRKLGWYARMNYLCCQTCAWADAAATLKKRGKDADEADIVFYHRQDGDAFKHRIGDWHVTGPQTDYLRRPLYLAHQGRAYEVVGVLKKYGLNAEWDGDTGMRIKVNPTEETK